MEAWPADLAFPDIDEDEEDTSPGDIIEDAENDLPIDELQALYRDAPDINE